jgi:hypothetical protein
MFDERITEIIFYQTAYDRVKYIAEELDKPVSLSVKNFFKLLKESGVVPPNIFDFNKAFDSFETIKLNLTTGHWHIVEFENTTSQPEVNSSINMQEGLNNAIKKESNLNTKLQNLYQRAINTRNKMFDKMVK